MPKSSNTRVLIVDERAETRATLARQLVDRQWDVVEVGTIAEVNQHIREVDIIVVRDPSPRQSSFEKWGPTRAEIRTYHIPFILISDLPVQADQREDVDAFLKEPLDVDELHRQIKILARLRTAEMTAQVAGAKFDAVINSMVEGVVTADVEGNFLSMNPAALKLYGFNALEEIPRSIQQQNQILRRTYPEGGDIALADLPILRAVTGKVVTGFEMKVTRRDTGRSWIGNFNATPVQLPDGKSLLVILTVSDITDRKHAEKVLSDAQAKLKNYAVELEQKVEERTASLRDAIGQMEEFSYTVSHDLRAPLRSIKGYAEVLEHDHAHRLKGDGPRFLERIIENADRMERLVNDVLTISRISSTKLRLERVALRPILDSIVTEYPNLHPQLVQLKIEILPDVVGHESLCIQVFANLLSNGAKFVHPGVKPEIRVWAETRGEHLRINVRDNGIGISPEFHQKIFGMFERLDADNRYSGTGIGLAIVRRAVEKMNGRAGVESDGTNGSLFWVELPTAA